MASVTQLVNAIVTVTGMPHAAVRAYSRALIDDGQLPMSAGKAIAHVNAEHVVRMLLAISLEPKYRETAKLVEEYANFTAKTSGKDIRFVDHMSLWINIISARKTTPTPENLFGSRIRISTTGSVCDFLDSSNDANFVYCDGDESEVLIDAMSFMRSVQFNGIFLMRLVVELRAHCDGTEQHEDSLKEFLSIKMPVEADD